MENPVDTAAMIEEARRRAQDLARSMAAENGGAASGSILGKRSHDEAWGGESSTKQKKVFIPDSNQDAVDLLTRDGLLDQLERNTGARVQIRGLDGSDSLHVVVEASQDAQFNHALSLVEQVVSGTPEERERALAAMKEPFQPQQGDANQAPAPSSAADPYGGSQQQPQQPQQPYGVSDPEDYARQFLLQSNRPAASRLIMIPNDAVGLVIGSGGQNIRQIQDMTGANVQVAKHCEPDTPDHRKITLEGTEEQIAAAEREIQAVVEARRNAQMGGGAPSEAGGMHAGLGFGSDHSVEVEIPNNKAGTLIGRQGETINMLQRQSGARIQVTRDGEVSTGANTRVVTITGTHESIQRAKELIRQVLEGESRDMMARVQSQPNAEVIWVPHEHVGLVIGRGGANIKRMQDQSGCNIQVSQDKSTPQRCVTIAGLPHAKEAIKQEIQMVVAQRGGTITLANGQPYTGAAAGYGGYGAPAGYPGADPYAAHYGAAGYPHAAAAAAYYPYAAAAAPQMPYGYPQQPAAPAAAASGSSAGASKPDGQQLPAGYDRETLAAWAQYYGYSVEDYIAYYTQQQQAQAQGQQAPAQAQQAPAQAQQAPAPAQAQQAPAEPQAAAEPASSASPEGQPQASQPEQNSAPADAPAAQE